MLIFSLKISIQMGHVCISFELNGLYQLIRDQIAWLKVLLIFYTQYSWLELYILARTVCGPNVRLYVREKRKFPMRKSLLYSLAHTSSMLCLFGPHACSLLLNTFERSAFPSHFSHSFSFHYSFYSYFFYFWYYWYCIGSKSCFSSFLICYCILFHSLLFTFAYTWYASHLWYASLIYNTFHRQLFRSHGFFVEIDREAWMLMNMIKP